MKRPARWRPAARRETKVHDGVVDETERQRGSRRVFVEDVAHDVELDRLERDVLRTVEPARLVVGQVELPQEKRVCRAVERGAACEAALRPPRAGRR